MQIETFPLTRSEGLKANGKANSFVTRCQSLENAAIRTDCEMTHDVEVAETRGNLGSASQGANFISVSRNLISVHF